MASDPIRHLFTTAEYHTMVEGLLEVYRDPAPHGYRQSLRLSREDTIAPIAFSDVNLSVVNRLG